MEERCCSSASRIPASLSSAMRRMPRRGRHRDRRSSPRRRCLRNVRRRSRRRDHPRPRDPHPRGLRQRRARARRADGSRALSVGVRRERDVRGRVSASGARGRLHGRDRIRADPGTAHAGAYAGAPVVPRVRHASIRGRARGHALRRLPVRRLAGPSRSPWRGEQAGSRAEAVRERAREARSAARRAGGPSRARRGLDVRRRDERAPALDPRLRAHREPVPRSRTLRRRRSSRRSSARHPPSRPTIGE